MKSIEKWKDKEKNSDELKKTFNNITQIITVVSLIFGIVVSVLGVLNYKIQSDNLEAQTQNLNITIQESQPKFNIWYIDVDSYYFDDARLSETGILNYPPIQYPILKNEVFEQIEDIEQKKMNECLSNSDNDKDMNLDSDEESDIIHSITFLVVTEIGKRKAESVKLLADEIYLQDNVQIFDAKGYIKDNYEDVITKNCTKKDKLFELGDLDTGEGILIPIFTYSEGGKTATKKCYLPRTIKYYDTYSKKEFEIDIRRIHQNPLYINTYIDSKG